jgi:RNA polymerase sigma-70 factor (ECF subfamily)
MEESDGAVIAGSLETPGAFGVIFDRHGSTLLRFLARRIDPAEAEDLLAMARVSARRLLDEDPAERAVAAADAGARWAQVTDAIGTLPEAERQVLLLFAWEELSYDEIALALGVPVGTVRSRLSRGRARLAALTHYRRAESQGAQIVTPLEDMFWGDRRYEALDLEGHRWHFAERLPEIRP